jgi:predicted TIM-barrel fold metal-dependent hydrolase
MTITERPVRTGTISADSHITEPHGTYIDRIDPKFRDRAPRIMDLPTMGCTMVVDPGSKFESKVPYTMVAAAGRPPETLGFNRGRPWEDLHPGGHDPVARLAEQDLDGVIAEVIYPSSGMIVCNHPDFDYKYACSQAYNQWIAEFASVAPERLIGLGQTTMRTVDDAIGELESIKALGLRGAMMPGVPNGPDYGDPHWDPFWRASLELELPLSFHILTVKGFGGSNFRGPRMNSFMAIIRDIQDIIGTFIFTGVFDRHPDLRIVAVEADAGWAPHWMYRADHAAKRHGAWLAEAKLQRKPSEYFREHIYMTFQDDWTAFRAADRGELLLNPDRLMWANDHPHSDATWPWSQDVIAEQTAGMDPVVVDRIVRRNCAELYRIEL